MKYLAYLNKISNANPSIKGYWLPPIFYKVDNFLWLPVWLFCTPSPLWREQVVRMFSLSFHKFDMKSVIVVHCESCYVLYISCRLLKDKERYENLARQEMLIIERRKERLLSESVSSSRDFMTLMASYFVTGLFVASICYIGGTCLCSSLWFCLTWLGAYSVLGPVVQSVISLTSSLRVILLTVLADSIYNILIFFAEKMWVAFALQKLLIFFQQKTLAYLRIARCKF